MKVELNGVWLPRAASTLADSVDTAWDVVYWMSIVFFVVIIGAQAYFMWKYKRRTETDVTSDIDHSTAVEITWTVIPSLLCIFLFLFGFYGYVNASVAPANAYEIQVTGQKWSWAFSHPNGKTEAGELHVPKGRPVKLIMSSRDVLHSFFVPEFRIKQDVVPGIYTTLWFEATEEGPMAIFCTEYCGTDHSAMLASMNVMNEGAFQEWLNADEGKGMTPVAMGADLFAKNACLSCHSATDATVKVGPSLYKVFGRQEQMADGSTLTADENYLRESILVPNAKLVKGFGPIMPAFKGVLKDKQIDAIIAYLKEQK